MIIRGWHNIEGRGDKLAVRPLLVDDIFIHFVHLARTGYSDVSATPTMKQVRASGRPPLCCTQAPMLPLKLESRVGAWLRCRECKASARHPAEVQGQDKEAEAIAAAGLPQACAPPQRR